MNDFDEKKENKKNEPNDKQMYSAASFCIMLVCVGIPLWWKTTEIYRVSLPYPEIDSLSNLNAQIQMNIHVATIDEAHGEVLVDKLKTFFKTSKLYKIHLKQHSVIKAVIGSCKSLEEIDKKIKHPNFEGSIQLLEIPGLTRFTPDNIVIGQHRTIYFSSGTDAVKLFNFLKANILKEDALLEAISQIDLPTKGNLNLRHKIPLSDNFDVLFTILNPEPETLEIRFNVNQAIEEYIKPFLKNLESLNGFHVKSQWLYFVGLQAQPKFLNITENVSHFALSEDLLPHVITPLEKKLASHVSKYPCLNFVLFIPPCSLAPLKIYTKKGFSVEETNAFTSPRWGGIQIHNPDRKSCSSSGRVIVEPDQRRIMSLFIQQFRELLGIDEPDSLKSKYPFPSSAYLQLWEKDLLLRTRAIEQLTSAKLTLQSLSKLLGKISNIVINDHVGDAIYTALKKIYKSSEAMSKGKLVEAYNNSKSAFLSSEKAFTDPSLLALLYFPDDQKYAVYIPLFLPVMIPILISFKHIKQWAEKKITQLKKPKTD